MALWQSLARFDGRCSERTWVYRVAHNIGASHVRRRHRIARERFTTLDDLSVATMPSSDDPESETGDRQALARLMALVHALALVDRQVVLLISKVWTPPTSARSPGSHPAPSPPSFTGSKPVWPANSSREGPMPIERPADPIKTLWETQSREIEAMPLEQIVMKARAFQTGVRRRQLLEYVAGAFAIVVFTSYVYVFPGWMIKTGSVLCILAIVNVFWQRHHRTAARRIPEAPAAALVDFHRSELLRHRDAVGGSWLWEILPTLPGLALILLGRWFQVHAPGVPLALDNMVTALGAIIVALILVIVVLIRRIRVYRLQNQIDELDQLRGA